MAQARVRAPLSPPRLAAIAIEERNAVQKPSEFTGLLELVAELTPRTVVEIGTYQGGTLWAFAQLATPDAVLVSVDLPGGDFGGGAGEAGAERFQTFRRPGQRIVALPLDSHDPETVAQVRRELHDQPVDFMFIDGDHSVAGVTADFELFSPLVRSGGIVAFHDILPDNDVRESRVDVFWERVSGDYRAQELLAPDEGLQMGRWAGIGVLWMP